MLVDNVRFFPINENHTTRQSTGCRECGGVKAVKFVGGTSDFKRCAIIEEKIYKELLFLNKLEHRVVAKI